MMDDLVREQNQVPSENLHQILVDRDRIGFLGQIQPPRDALHVGIYDTPAQMQNARGLEPRLRSFALRPGTVQKLIYFARTHRPKSESDLGGGARRPNHDLLCYGESGGANVLASSSAGRWRNPDPLDISGQAGGTIVPRYRALAPRGRRHQQFPGTGVVSSAQVTFWDTHLQPRQTLFETA